MVNPQPKKAIPTRFIQCVRPDPLAAVVQFHGLELATQCEQALANATKHIRSLYTFGICQKFGEPLTVGEAAEDYERPVELGEKDTQDLPGFYVQQIRVNDPCSRKECEGTVELRCLLPEGEEVEDDSELANQLSVAIEVRRLQMLPFRPADLCAVHGMRARVRHSQT